MSGPIATRVARAIAALRSDGAAVSLRSIQDQARASDGHPLAHTSILRNDEAYRLYCAHRTAPAKPRLRATGGGAELSGAPAERLKTLLGRRKRALVVELLAREAEIRHLTSELRLYRRLEVQGGLPRQPEPVDLEADLAPHYRLLALGRDYQAHYRPALLRSTPPDP